ncbi:unnamed protein product [Heligmosomoides polygyrus]|uniref:Uncharacterized protein n=1 Tax=Heligmosomoides polygyrus TaxID=6339 RepID=A0A3P7ZA28_HELPZ|nr:unnamed protein product [Heligmosomoides polygyrus]
MVADVFGTSTVGPPCKVANGFGTYTARHAWLPTCSARLRPAMHGCRRVRHVYGRLTMHGCGRVRHVYGSPCMGVADCRGDACEPPSGAAASSCAGSTVQNLPRSIDVLTPIPSRRPSTVVNYL